MTVNSNPLPIASPLSSLHKSAGATLGNWFGCELPTDFGDWQTEYRAARESVALIDKNYRAYLRFAGPDRVRYLNAILTNNIKDLKNGDGIVSLFLNPQGKIQAEIETYATPESLFCVSHAMISATLVPALEKFIIMDDVTLTDETSLFGTLVIEGPFATKVVKNITGIDLVQLSELSFCETSVSGIFCGLTKRSPGGIASAEFLALQSDLPALWQTLLEAVQKAGGRAIGYQALNTLRLEQNIPWFGYDFGDKQIPHEAGLENSHISFTKGCYTGQEIVERVRSRGQVNWVRILLKLAGSEPPQQGAVLTSAGKEIGYVTRAAFSPSLQSVIAMAYVRRENSAVGSELDCGTARAAVIAGPLS
jgi:folate-binding protein YgfZ